MDSELGRCLSDTLNPDPNVRIKAELRVNDLIQYPETAIALASILSYDQVDLPLRQHSSGIVLRKYVREHWSPYFGSFKGSAPSLETKDVIRTTIFRCLSDPLSKIRSAAANVLSLIANCDWPDSYPDLLNNLLSLLSSNSPYAVHGAMQVFTEFAKDDLTEDQILPVLQQLLPVLLNILGNCSYSAITRARSVSVFRQCLQALYMVKEQHPQAIKEAIERILPEWIEVFRVLLDQDLTPEICEGGQWDALLIRIQIFKTLDIINTAFNRSLRLRVNTFLDISLHHLRTLLPVFQKYYVDPAGTAPISTEDEEITIPRLAAPLLNYVSNLCKRSSTKDWCESNKLTYLVEATFHWIQMTGEDEELWTNNPNIFIAQEDDETLEYSLRVVGLDLLSDLLDKYPAHTIRALQNTTQQLINASNLSRQQGSQEWWRPLEAALAALGAVSPSVLEVLQEESQQLKPLDIEALLLNIVPPLLSLSDHPFLQGRGFVFASQYAKCLPSSLAGQYLNAALEVLESIVPGTVVKVSAVKAIRNFSAQVEESIIFNAAPRIIGDLGPFLTTTTEDTLTLVLEAISVVVEVGEGKWLNSELARLLSQAALDVWARNMKDPIILSVLEDLLTELADSGTPGVYQAVVMQCLPTLCGALVQLDSEQPSIADSAIDLVAALAQGAKRGALGDGFFAAFATPLFALLQNNRDSGLLESALVLLTLVIRKDVNQVLSWMDNQNQTGLVHVLSLIGRVLASPENDAGGLVVGDLVIHLLRNAGDSILPSLPSLIQALVNRMPTAKTVTLNQSLITPMAFLLHLHRDSVLDVLGSFTVNNIQPSQTGLEVFISSWLENADGLQGMWAHRINIMAICSVLSSNRADVLNILVKGDMIIPPETADVIMTRSKTKKSPHQYQYIPFVVKALKQLLQDLNEEELLEIKHGDIESDDGGSEWGDSGSDGEKLIQGLKKEDYAYLSEILGAKNGFDEDDDILGAGMDDEDLKNDPIYVMNIKDHLKDFISQFVQQTQVRPIIDQLNTQETLVVKRLVERK